MEILPGGPQGARCPGFRRSAAADTPASQKSPRCSRKLRKQFTQVLIDEYQDTNHLQFEIARLLCEKHRNLCVVGDDDQSIYGFRGAEVSNILEFEQRFPDARIITLSRNYRSTENILKAANAVINRNINRRQKEPVVKAGRGPADRNGHRLRMRMMRPVLLHWQSNG
ncbi:UvrD-helicase domain-containing protein [bacterium]|nr:UvrD-helicase domain-containing protein [bacterium]